MLRNAFFIVGCILMFLGLFVYFAVADDTRFHRGLIFNLGLAIAIASHGLPSDI
jgi:hypothetical protein